MTRPIPWQRVGSGEGGGQAPARRGVLPIPLSIARESHGASTPALESPTDRLPPFPPIPPHSSSLLFVRTSTYTFACRFATAVSFLPHNSPLHKSLATRRLRNTFRVSSSHGQGTRSSAAIHVAVLARDAVVVGRNFSSA